MTLSKVLICPFFGDLPPWMDAYWENAEILKDQGYDFLLDDDEADFRDRVRDRLGIEPPRMHNTGNIWDFRPALGHLYAKEIKEFDFWGHTDFDCVYGRVQDFYLDTALERYDILSDHWNYMAGPWTLYRNCAFVREFFDMVPGWESVMSDPTPDGWVEKEYAEAAKKALGVRLRCTHAWLDPYKLLWDGDALTHDGREVSFFHFRHTKQYPEIIRT